MMIRKGEIEKFPGEGRVLLSIHISQHIHIVFFIVYRYDSKRKSRSDRKGEKIFKQKFW